MLQLQRKTKNAGFEGDLTNAIIYKIATNSQWEAAKSNGCFKGAPIDLQDGYIHFSTNAQVRETAAKHFSGQSGLLLLSVDASRLGDALKYEVSRGGVLFPHLYGELPLDAVLAADAMPIGTDGIHKFPHNIYSS